MSNKGRFTAAEDARLVAAIGRAEKGSRGEVRVHVDVSVRTHAPLSRARKLFDDLGMGRTSGGTAVLLYVAVADRKAAVYAGVGIHGATEPGFWQTVTDTVATGARDGDLAGGIERALDQIGVVLREHAPGEDVAGNELPDQVSTA
jgi:uncharacterized membrane protein